MESIFDPDLFISRDYETITFSYGKVTQSLFSLKSSTTDYDLTGQIVWPAAEYLSQYIIDNPLVFQDQNVLEFGSGAGLSGLVASQFAKTVVLTDGNDIVCELLEKNKAFSGKNNVSVRKLEWGTVNMKQCLEEIGEISVAIGADVLFWPASIKPLVESFQIMKQKFTKAKIFLSICYRVKQTEENFDKCLKEAGLKRVVILNQGSIFLYLIDFD